MFESYYDQSLLGRLDLHVRENPDQVIYTFLPEGKAPQTLTFRELSTRVWTIAARLAERFEVGDRAVLLYPQGLEFICAFLGCLAAGIVAVPADRPRRARRSSRLQRMIVDCKPVALLTTECAGADFSPETTSLPVLFTDNWPTIEAGPLAGSAVRSEAVAFLQYTSGSTGTPKGVRVTHANIVSNERQIQGAFGHFPWDPVNRNPVVVSWLPMFHDMGLVGNVLQPLYVGFPAVLLSPSSFLRKPSTWLRAISDYRATTTGAPNFAYDLCVRSVTKQEKESLDLSSVRVMYSGAEPVRAETLDRFSDTFRACGFRRSALFTCYGLAEATLFVSGGPHDAEGTRLYADGQTSEARRIVSAPLAALGSRCLVGSGRPAVGVSVFAVDPVRRVPLSEGDVGELWVSSPGVSSGYFGQSVDSTPVFDNYLSTGEGPFLNTGDLGLIHRGQLFVTGRSKDVMIANGRNIYPQDVEAEVEAVLPPVVANSCAAFGIDVDGQERLAIVVEADRKIVRAARHLADHLPTPIPSELGHLWDVVDRVCLAVLTEIEVPVKTLIFVRPGTFRRTSSGKVQRAATRVAFTAGRLDVVVAWDASTPSRLSRPVALSTSSEVPGAN